jgi:hypothetical protein
MGLLVRTAASGTMLFSFFIFIRSFIGLGFRLSELVMGERDYSGLMVIRAAEDPPEKLLFQMLLSFMVLGFLIIAGVLEDEKVKQEQ